MYHLHWLWNVWKPNYKFCQILDSYREDFLFIKEIEFIILIIEIEYMNNYIHINE